MNECNTNMIWKHLLNVYHLLSVGINVPILPLVHLCEMKQLSYKHSSYKKNGKMSSYIKARMAWNNSNTLSNLYESYINSSKLVSRNNDAMNTLHIFRMKAVGYRCINICNKTILNMWIFRIKKHSIFSVLLLCLKF